MKLRTASRFLLGLLVGAVMVNLLLLLLIWQAQQAGEQAVAQRERARAAVAEVVQGTDLLGSLVQNFSATGQTHYLDLYYEILGVWAGERAAPANALNHWRERLGRAAAASAPAKPPERPVAEQKVAPRSLVQGFADLDFSSEELAATREVLAALKRLQQIEVTAFAATQGLFDRERGEFVDEGKPDTAYALSLVHSSLYAERRNTLAQAVQALQLAAERRTGQALADARQRQVAAVLLALTINLLMACAMVAALVFIRRRVLQPIELLAKDADQYARGNLAHRTHAETRQVNELSELSRSLQAMATALQIDLHQRDSQQQELQRARDAAEAAAKAKADFLANMSHEIRTPLNAVMGMTELVLQSPLNPRQHDQLEKAQGASRHLLALLDDVLDYSKIEAGGLSLSPAALQLGELAAQALAMVRQRAQAKSLQLLFDCSDEALLCTPLLADKLRLLQVLTNLLGNAVKFTEVGHVRLVVARVGPPSSDGQLALALSVQDSGIGISEAAQAQLFREFSQADESITRRFGGTGLGLAISKRLLGLMGGSIRVSSQAGQGSEFKIELNLPLAGPPEGELPALAVPAQLLLAVGADAARDGLLSLLGKLPWQRPLRSRLLSDAEALQAFIESSLQATSQGQPPGDCILMLDAQLAGLSLLETVGRAKALRWRLAVLTRHPLAEATARELEGQAVPVLQLPLLPQNLRQLWRWDTVTEPGQAVSRLSTAQLTGLRVLVVEDNPLNQEVAQHLLELQGVQVRVANDGAQALALLDASPQAVDVVLMDLHMPVMGGIEATERLRRDSRFADLPILAMTAAALPDELARCRAAGMQGEVLKPVNPRVLLAALLPWHVGSKAPDAAAPDAPAQPSTAGVLGLDMTVLAESSGGDEALMHDLLAMFLDLQADALAPWPEAPSSSHMPALRAAAHKLQGSLASLGAKGLRETVQALERAAKEGDTATVNRLLLPAREDLRQLCIGIKAWLRQHAL